MISNHNHSIKLLLQQLPLPPTNTERVGIPRGLDHSLILTPFWWVVHTVRYIVVYDGLTLYCHYKRPPTVMRNKLRIFVTFQHRNGRPGFHWSIMVSPKRENGDENRLCTMLQTQLRLVMSLDNGGTECGRTIC